MFLREHLGTRHPVPLLLRLRERICCLLVAVLLLDGQPHLENICHTELGRRYGFRCSGVLVVLPAGRHEWRTRRPIPRDPRVVWVSVG